MKGYRTVIFGLIVATVPAGLQYLAGIDWTTIVSPTMASVIVGALTIGLRFFSTTEIGKKD